MITRTRLPHAAHLLLLGVLLCGAMALYGDSSSKKDYSLIEGTVWGPDQHPAYGVPVEIRKVGSKKPVWELVSDRHGEFAVRVPNEAADYRVEAQIKVSPGKTRPAVTVHVEKFDRVNVGLHLEP